MIEIQVRIFKEEATSTDTGVAMQRVTEALLSVAPGIELVFYARQHVLASKIAHVTVIVSDVGAHRTLVIMGDIYTKNRNQLLMAMKASGWTAMRNSIVDGDKEDISVSRS